MLYKDNVDTFPRSPIPHKPNWKSSPSTCFQLVYAQRINIISSSFCVCATADSLLFFLAIVSLECFTWIHILGKFVRLIREASASHSWSFGESCSKSLRKASLATQTLHTFNGETTGSLLLPLRRGKEIWWWRLIIQFWLVVCTAVNIV